MKEVSYEDLKNENFNKVEIINASFSIIFNKSIASLLSFFLNSSISIIVFGNGGRDSIFSKILLDCNFSSLFNYYFNCN